MAVATELVIGKSGKAHISAQDIRQLLRGLSGNYGICRIHDIRGGTDYNCTVNIQTAGAVKIGAGSVLWNGMQIRNSEQINVPYSLTPAGSRYIVLHYTKSTVDGVAGIEQVEWDVLTTEPTNTETFADNVTEAWYTYASFAVQQQIPTGFSYNSAITFIDTPEANRDKMTSLQTAINAAITPDVLYSGTMEYAHVYSLTSRFTDYKFIGFQTDDGEVVWYKSTDFSVGESDRYISIRNNTSMYFLIGIVAVRFPTANTIRIGTAYTSRLYVPSATWDAPSSSSTMRPTKIYGWGKGINSLG